jgi:hypothetical protein
MDVFFGKLLSFLNFDNKVQSFDVIFAEADEAISGGLCFSIFIELLTITD